MEVDYKKCRLTGYSLHIQFTNGESWSLPIDTIVDDVLKDVAPRGVCPEHGEPISNLIYFACGCSQDPKEVE